MDGPWREPGEESVDLYPGLVVWDDRVSGSITIGRSRLPVWAIIHTAIHEDWDRVEWGWSPTEHYGYTADDLSKFLGDLLELRGEFGRLLLVLADAERCEQARGGGLLGPSWWETKRHRKRVGDQLRRCLRVLDQDPTDAIREFLAAHDADIDDSPTLGDWTGRYDTAVARLRELVA